MQLVAFRGAREGMEKETGKKCPRGQHLAGQVLSFAGSGLGSEAQGRAIVIIHLIRAEPERLQSGAH